MNELIAKAGEMFEKGEIDLFIGYEKGSRGPRPLFCENAEETRKLIFDDACTGNLAVYLTRKELVGGRKVGVFASYHTLKSIVRLFAENQLDSPDLKVLAVTTGGSVREFKNAEETGQYLKETTPPVNAKDDGLIERIDKMTPEERWQFWTDELSKCFKCYACRAACPMCYCTKCIVEVNAPQWIQPWADTPGNMEWQINRSMHMTGRCSNCGSCGAACPVGIPVHLLTRKISEVAKANFEETNGGEGNVLSTFKPDDKESFIM